MIVAGEDLDEGILAVLVGDGLEHEGRGHAAGGDDEFLRFAVLGVALWWLPSMGLGSRSTMSSISMREPMQLMAEPQKTGNMDQLPHALAQAAGSSQA